MLSSNVWNCKHIYCKEIMKKIPTLIFFVTLMFLLDANVANAQRAKVKNQEKYDKQRIHFGFLLGINNTDFKVTRSDNFYLSDSALVIEPDGQSGFNLGIVSNL